MNPGPFLLLPKFLFYAIIHNKSIRISEVETEMDEQGGLFERTAYQPLAERVRPQSLEEFVGQEHLLGSGKVLRRLIESDHITSMIFCANYCSADQSKIHYLFCGDEWD